MELKEAENKNKKSYLWIGLAIVCAVILLLWFQYSKLFQIGINNATVEKDSVDSFISALMAITTIIGIIGSLYMYHRQASASEKQIPFIERQASAAEKQASIMDKQASDNEKNNLENKNDEFFQNYSQAIDQLGSENMIVRLGAISKLEMIANKSNEYYWPIMENLTAYVREYSSIKDPKVKEQNEVSEDIQAILNVIRKHNQLSLEESRTLNLRNTFLRKAKLGKAHLEGADLTDSILTEAYLKETHLEGASLSNVNFYHAILSGADLKQTHIEGASFERAVLEEVNLSGVDASLGAHFSGANLKRSNLRKIKLWGADLSGANLEEVHLEKANLEDADLKKAKLQGAHLEMALLSRADLTGANFEGAHLEQADLIGTNLKEAKNVSVEQLSKVHTLYQAQLDPELEKELRAKGFDYLLDDMSLAWL